MAKFIPDSVVRTLAVCGATTIIGFILGAVHEHGRWSVIDDIYHKHNGFVVIPDVTDEEGNFFKDQD